MFLRKKVQDLVSKTDEVLCFAEVQADFFSPKQNFGSGRPDFRIQRPARLPQNLLL